MDALWNLEDQLRLSTPIAATLLVCTVVLVIGVCIAIFRVVRNGTNRVVAEAEDESMSNETDDYGSSCDRELLVKDVLSESVRWSKPQRWEVVERWRWWRRGGTAAKWRGWPRRESRRRGAVWQRPILMGEKCELPRFSGVILYDGNGQPLHRADDDNRF